MAFFLSLLEWTL